MNNNLLETKTVNSNELIGNGKKYKVPLYQRDYSWNEDNWEDLWSDILLVEKEETVHYMGAIVLQNKGKKTFSIIDGQQRLTTITLIALACIQKIKDLVDQGIEKEANEERIKLLSSKFIGDKDPSSLTYFSKLRLNENNNSFFQSYILTFRTPVSATLRNLIDSDKLILRALNFFKQKVNQHFKNNKNGAAIAQFLNEAVAEKLMFIQITVEDELRAYTVFETLNSRGVGLTVTDLLKNYLFSLVNDVDLPFIKKQWERIVDTIGLDKFPIFLRHFWISQNSFIRHEYLYKGIRNKIKNSEHLIALLDDLEKNAEVYVALTDSAHELWKGNLNLQTRIKELSLFRVKQCFPLLLIAYQKLPNLFEKIAKITTVTSFRSTVIGGFHSGKLLEAYSKVALKVAKGEYKTANQIAEGLKNLYVNDTDFKNDFSTASLNTRRNKKLIRYILFEIEQQISGASYDFLANPATIEHILPESMPEKWESSFDSSIMENYIFRLGNYTLLKSKNNNTAGISDYDAKLEIFAKSNFIITKRIEYPNWSPNNLNNRQKFLANEAIKIWRLPYFDKKPQSKKTKSLNFIEEIIEKDLKEGKHGGRILTRFPPEPNGFLHIGHAKALWVSFSMAQKYGGETNLRFDDTNPTTEETRYVEAIKKDIQWLGYQWKDEPLFTSDYFQQLYDFAVDLIKKGHAYVDDSTAAEIAEMKGTPTKDGVLSPYASRSVEENLDLFTRMKNGEFPDGSRVLRARISMTSPNMLLRDPVLYRIKHETHHRTGDDWCIYPLYDFAHGQSDSIENITHSLCSLEFIHHRALYNWFIKKLEIFPSRQIEFARMNVEYMITSKRKLLKLVNENYVTGWDDPRMPTLSGMRRRGYPAKAIRDFCESTGLAKRDNLIEMSKLEFSVRKELNATAPRVMAVLDPLKVVITNYPEGQTEDLTLINNPEDETQGSRTIPFSREIYIEKKDFMEDPPKKYFRLAPGRNVRLKGAYIIHCEDFVKDENGNVTEVHCTYYDNSKSGQDTSGVKSKGVLHWVSIEHAKEAKINLYDRLFTDPSPTGHEDKDYLEFFNEDSLKVIETAYIEPSLAQAKPLDRFQFMRMGYFCADESSTEENPVFNRTVTLKDSWGKKKGK